MIAHNRSQIESLAVQIFDTSKEQILSEYSASQREAIEKVRLTNNAGGYLPALTMWGADRVRALVIAKANAYAEAFECFSVAPDQSAKTALRRFAREFTAGSIASIRAHKLIRRNHGGSGGTWHLQIERAMESALKEGLLTLKRQEIKVKLSSAKETLGTSSPDDRKFAQLALEEARRSVSESDDRPHPKVGAVVVKNGKILSSAHRGEVLGNHAEFIALEKKLPDRVVAGATVYTTLEPCTTRNHPKLPCASRLIERKVARVVVGILDPDPRITGRGVRALRAANIVIDVFPPDLMTEVEELNREFARYHGQANEPPSKTTKAPVIEEYGPNLRFLGARSLKVDFEESRHARLTIHESITGPCDALIASFRNEPAKDRRIEPLYSVTAQLIFVGGDGVEIGNGISGAHWLEEGSDRTDLVPGGQARSLVLLVRGRDDMIATPWKRHTRGSWMGRGLEDDAFPFDQCPSTVAIRLLSKNGDLLYEVALSVVLGEGGFSATPGQQ